MVDVFLLNPPGNEIRTGRLVRESKSKNQGWPPIFLAYATGVLEKQGYECVLYDAFGEEGRIPSWNAIEEAKPELIAFHWTYDTRYADLVYANSLAAEYRVVLVGPWSAHFPEAIKVLAPNVEAMTHGPFEYTLANLIEKRPTLGVTYKDGEYIPQGEPYTTAQLNYMPFVSSVYKAHLDIKRYRQTSFRYPFVDIFTSRDCPHRCAFCSWVNGMYQLHPNRWAKRSLSNVMAELWYINNEMPEVKQTFFQDSTLVTPWARELSQEIIDTGPKNFCWGAYSRADKDYDTLKLMHDAGCRTLHVGYEVPIQKYLDEIKKDITVEQEAQFIKDVNKVGLWTSSSFMIFPWMSEEDIKFMVRWIKYVGATRVNVAQLQPYPNVPIIDVINAYKDIPGQHMMDFDEMKKWEQYFFKEFYLKNPKFWWQVLTNPREWLNVLNDAKGMLKFLGEK